MRSSLSPPRNPDRFIYVATKLGIQICDTIGRVVGILDKPQPGVPSSVVFGGADLHTLYVTSGDKVFRRWTKCDRRNRGCNVGQAESVTNKFKIFQQHFLLLTGMPAKFRPTQLDFHCPLTEDFREIAISRQYHSREPFIQPARHKSIL